MYLIWFAFVRVAGKQGEREKERERERENIWYYNKDENRAHPSSGVHVKHWINNGSN